VCAPLCLSFPFYDSGREKDNRRRWRVVGTRQASRVHDAFSRWPRSFCDQLFAARAPSCHTVDVLSSVSPHRGDARARSCRRVGEGSITPPFEARGTVITLRVRGWRSFPLSIGAPTCQKCADPRKSLLVVIIERFDIQEKSQSVDKVEVTFAERTEVVDLGFSRHLLRSNRFDRHASEFRSIRW